MNGRLAAFVFSCVFPCAVVVNGAAPAVADHIASTVEIVRDEVLPRVERLAAATLKLQNAVVRHCTIPTASTLGFVREAFAGVLISAAAAEPFSFVTSDQRRLPSRFMTGVADTAFSRSRLSAIVAGNEPPPASLTALQAEEPALTGLPALEAVLFSQDLAPNTAVSSPRCQLAQAIVAGLRESAHTSSKAWSVGRVPPHWSEDPIPLADRLRLRDLVQGAIDVSDRLDRMLAEFDRQSDGNDELPFAARGPNLVYLAALMEALARHVEYLMGFAEDGSPAENVLADAADALDLSRSRFNRAAMRDSTLADVRPPMGAARIALVSRLPFALGFDRSAFVPPIGGFGDVPDEFVRE